VAKYYFSEEAQDSKTYHPVSAGRFKDSARAVVVLRVEGFEDLK